MRCLVNHNYSLKSLTHILLIVTLSISGMAEVQVHAQKKKRKGKEEKTEITKYERANAEYLFIEAQKFFLLEDYQRSLTFLDQSLEIDTENHAAHFKIAEIHLITEKYTEGLSAINKALTLKKDNRYYYILAAQLYKATDDLAAAARQYELMVANTTDYKEFLLDMVDTYIALEDFDKAISTLNLTEKEFRTPDKFALQKKDLLLQAGKTEEATSYLASLLQKKPDDIRLTEEYVALLDRQQKTNIAISYLEAQALKTEAMKPLLASFYLRNSISDKATTLLNELFSSKSLSVRNQLRLVQEILAAPEKNNLPLAQRQLQQMQTSLPGNTEVLNLQSKLLALGLSSDPSAAYSTNTQTMEVLIKLVENDPATLTHWRKLLTYQYNTENWSGLLGYSEQSLDYFPNQGLFYFYYGSATLYTNDTEEATDLLKQALRLSSSSDTLKARIYSKQSEIAFVNQQIDQAKSLFSQASSLVNHSEIINNHSFRLALHKVDVDEALQRSQSLVDDNPTQLKYIRTQAFVHFQSANYAKAKQLLEEGFQKLEGQINGQARELYGDILIKLDLVDEAIEQWQKAKILGNTSKKLSQKIANKEYF